MRLGRRLGLWALGLEFSVTFFDFLRRQESTEATHVMYDVWLFQPEQLLEQMNAELPQLLKIADQSLPDTAMDLMAVNELVDPMLHDIAELRDKLNMRSTDEPEEILNLDQMDAFRDSVARLAAALRDIPQVDSREQVIAGLRRHSERSTEVSLPPELMEFFKGH